MLNQVIEIDLITGELLYQIPRYETSIIYSKSAKLSKLKGYFFRSTHPKVLYQDLKLLSSILQFIKDFNL